jgi:CBS-domain-containing membrane protein
MRSTVADVMTREVVTVDALAPFKEVVRLMQEHRVSALPVVDDDGELLGIVSEGDLIFKEDLELWGRGRRFETRSRVAARAKATGRTAWELMSTPVISVGEDAPIGEAARKMYRHGVKRLPVLDAKRRLVGIVSRVDVLKVFLREDAEIEREIREDVIRRTLWIEPDTIRVVVHDGVVTLQGQVERRGLLAVIDLLAASIDGVVRVDDRLSYLNDDGSPSDLPAPWTTVAPKAER